MLKPTIFLNENAEERVSRVCDVASGASAADKPANQQNEGRNLFAIKTYRTATARRTSKLLPNSAVSRNFLCRLVTAATAVAASESQAETPGEALVQVPCNL